VRVWDRRNASRYDNVSIASSLCLEDSRADDVVN
jgi:hypothetical protein